MPPRLFAGNHYELGSLNYLDRIGLGTWGVFTSPIGTAGTSAICSDLDSEAFAWGQLVVSGLKLSRLGLGLCDFYVHPPPPSK